MNGCTVVRHVRCMDETVEEKLNTSPYFENRLIFADTLFCEECA